MGLQLGDEIATIIVEDAKLRATFVSWLAGECRIVSRKRNRLAKAEALLLRAGGASRSAMEHAATLHRLYLSFWF